ncbi:MAG: hypothetical protein ACK56N_11535, partial [Betaproteobacteria bacterium]
MPTLRSTAVLPSALIFSAALSVCTATDAQAPARVDDSQSAKQLRQIKRAPGERPVVTIYEL